MKILITAGPTYERIDPVRFIGNYSTGKMGFALARACVEAGYEVVLVAGPVQQQIDSPHVNRIDVESAAEMYNVAVAQFPQCNAAILCAAVADFTPIKKADSKIKREKDRLLIELEPTKDIAAELGRMKTADQKLVGFALETDNEEINAQHKLQKKNLDFIVLNSLKDKGAGFGHDTNKITIINKIGDKKVFPLKPKNEVAKDIIDELLK